MLRFARRLLFSACSVAIAGCAVGPNFKRPPAAVPGVWADPSPASYPTTRPVAFSVDPADLSAWWKQLGDPQLNSLIDRAIVANLDLKTATSAVRQARYSVSIAAGEFFPQIDGSGAYTRSGGGIGDASRGLYRTGLDASWELDIFGRIRRQVEAADAAYHAAIENRRDVLVTLVSEVAIDYVDLRGIQRQIEIAQGNLNLQRKNAELVRRRQVGGLVSPLDVAQADASVATTASQIPQLQVSERTTIYALSVLLDRTPDALLNELSQGAPIPIAPLDVPIGLPSDLLRRRPDIRRTEEELHAATAEIGVAVADLFPRFSLTGSFQLASRKPASLFDWANNTFSYGPSFTTPLFDAGIIFNNIKVQDEAAEQALITYRRTVLTALQDVENAIISYVKEYEHRAALADAVTANQDAVKYATTLYTTGQTDFLNVLSAQQAVLSSENALVQSDRATVTDLIALYKALGGGWEPETTPGLTNVPPIAPVVPTTAPTTMP